MNFSQLESFITVVRLRSFSSAAKKLHFSQSTITSHINELEKELEQQLLFRNTRGLHLTEMGLHFYRFAVATVARRDALLAESRKGKGQRKVLRIVTSSIPGRFFLPVKLAEYQQIHPDVFFKIIPSDSRSITDNMTEHQAHIGFCGAERQDKNFIYRPVCTDRLVVLTPNTSFYQQLDRSLSFPQHLLLSLPMIARAPTSGTRIAFEQYLSRQGIRQPPNIISEMADASAILNAVCAGMGIAVLSAYEVRWAEALGEILCFPLEGQIMRNLYIVKGKEDILLRFEADFYQFITAQARGISEPH